MRAILILLLLGALSFAADAPQRLPPAKITGVEHDPVTRALVVRYEISGTAHEQRLMLPEQISDFRYCRWMGDSGIAFVIRTGIGEACHYFYSAFYLTDQPRPHRPALIPAPESDFSVLGIGNTGGDSLVITAARHRRAPSESVSGWLYIDNCPMTDLELPGGVRGYITPFELPAEQAVPAK